MRAGRQATHASQAQCAQRAQAGEDERAQLRQPQPEQKPAARPDELAAERAVGAGQLIPLIDFRIAHPAAALFLVLPVDIH